MDNNKDIFNDMEYTVVLDGNYRSPYMAAEMEKEAAEAEAQQSVKEAEKEIDESKASAEKLYETYEKMLFRSFGELEEADVAEAKKQVDKLRKILFPLIESNQYRDYKKPYKKASAISRKT